MSGTRTEPMSHPVQSPPAAAGRGRFRITAIGHNARLPQNISELLSGERGPAADAHAIQPYYTRLLAGACGLTVRLAHEGEAITIIAS